VAVWGAITTIEFYYKIFSVSALFKSMQSMHHIQAHHRWHQNAAHWPVSLKYHTLRPSRQYHVVAALSKAEDGRKRRVVFLGTPEVL